MVCLRNICINTLHKRDDDDDNNNILKLLSTLTLNTQFSLSNNIYLIKITTGVVPHPYFIKIHTLLLSSPLETNKIEEMG